MVLSSDTDIYIYVCSQLFHILVVDKLSVHSNSMFFCVFMCRNTYDKLGMILSQ